MTEPPSFPLPPRLAPALLVAAPVLLVACTIVQVTGDGLGADRVGGAVQVWCAAAFALVVVVLAGLLAPHRPQLAAVLALTGVLGTAGSVGFGIDGMVAAVDPTLAPSEQDVTAEIVLGLMLPGILFPLTLAALGAALGRIGRIPAPAAAALVVGALAFPVSRIGEIAPLALVVDVVLLGALTAVAVSLTRPEPAVAVPGEGATLGAVA